MLIKNISLRGFVATLAILFFILASAQRSYTYTQYLSKAKSLGYPAENCSYCHKMPDSGSDWNERGKWLIEEKKNRKADEVDVKWLKDYKPLESTSHN